jgi:hypothetical protein
MTRYNGEPPEANNQQTFNKDRRFGGSPNALRPTFIWTHRLLSNNSLERAPERVSFKIHNIVVAQTTHEGKGLERHRWGIGVLGKLRPACENVGGRLKIDLPVYHDKPLEGSDRQTSIAHWASYVVGAVRITQLW